MSELYFLCHSGVLYISILTIAIHESNMKVPRITLISFLSGILIFIGATISSRTASAEEALRIVSSIPPLASLAKSIGGERVQVSAIISSAIDPHHFELKPSAITTLSEADLVLFVGERFEYWAQGLKDRMSDKTLYLEDVVPDGSKLLSNYHSWLDPVLVIPFIEKITEKLVKLDKEHASEFGKNRDVLVRNIEDSVSVIKSGISSWEFKSYFCAHPAWSYFAKRFDLVELGCVRNNHNDELGSQKLSRLYQLARDPKNKFFFIDQNESIDSVQSFTDDNKLTIVILDGLGNVEEPYPDFIKRNFSIMQKKMQGAQH